MVGLRRSITHLVQGVFRNHPTPGSQLGHDQLIHHFPSRRLHNGLLRLWPAASNRTFVSRAGKQQWATQRLGGLRSGGLVVRIAFHTDATLALAKPTPNIEDYVFDGFESPGTDEDPEVWATERDLAASRMLRKFGTCTRVC